MHDEVGPRVWFVANAHFGLGHAIAVAAASTDDTVILTAPVVAPLIGTFATSRGRLTLLEVDPFDGCGLRAALRDAATWHERVDVMVVNSADLLIDGDTYEETREHSLKSEIELVCEAPGFLSGANGRTVVQIRGDRRATTMPGRDACSAALSRLDAGRSQTHLLAIDLEVTRRLEDAGIAAVSAQLTVERDDRDAHDACAELIIAATQL